ncbi:MAG TPA: acetolactate synthase small subunit [Desulfurella acetivorans]|uniref:Acetolactate synthase small subunit n=1 Tax=Desulfurella acetivorans TaxID=33002 RepID=A0A7C6A8A5_DESAE|nr:acetolactate synthase small subunit [Desulfurella acetivorans]
MKRIFSVIVENEAGVLSRVSNLFSARGYNIESLNVAPINDLNLSRMTIVTEGDSNILEQIGKQLNKLIDTIKVIEYGDGVAYVEREMALIKMHTDSSTRAEILRIVDIFRGKIVDVSPNSYTIEVTGSSEKINAILNLLEPLGIKEIARTGKVAMSRESKQ